MAGVYYLDTKRFISTSTGDDNLQGIVTVKRQPQFGNLANPTLSFLADNNHNRAWALFGNVAYDLTDRLELSFAGRYDKDRRRQAVRVEQGSDRRRVGEWGARAVMSRGGPSH